MKTKQIILAVACIFIVSLSACNKYKDGPLISLRSKTERVANNWKVAQALDDGKDVTSDYNKYELSLTKNGSASLSANFTFLGGKYEYITDGTWDFTSNKEKLSFNFSNDDADGVYKILKLKEDEMWIKKDGGTLELHYVTR